MALNRTAALIALLAAASCGGDDAPAADAAPGADAAAAIDARPRADAEPRPDAAPPVAGDECAVAIEIADHPATEAGDTTGFGNVFAGSCSTDSAKQPDVVYHTSLGDVPIDLIADVAVDETADPPFDAVLSARGDCTKPDSELGCADAGWGEHLELLAATGDVFLIVDGTSRFGAAPAGAYTLTTALRAIDADGAPCDPTGVTDRCDSGLRCAGGTCTADSAELACTEAVDLTAALAGGSATVDGFTAPYQADFYAGSCAADSAASFPERIYRIDLAAAADLDASTDHPETTFDTYLYLRKDACDGAEVGCQDDVDVTTFNLRSHLAAPALAAGTYYLFVDGSSAAPGTGAYRLTVSVTPL